MTPSPFYATNTDHQDFPVLFVEVILPLALNKNYTYKVPKELNCDVKQGKRVAVQFGKNKLYTGLIYKITSHAPKLYEAKYILSILDKDPIVFPNHFQFWEWITSYYMCSMGEVMAAALPSALKLASETRIRINQLVKLPPEDLNDKERLILEALEIRSELTIGEIVTLLEQKTVFPVIRSLEDKKLISVSEHLSKDYKPKLETYINLNPTFDTTKGIKELFRVLEKKPKRLELFMTFIQLRRQQSEVRKKDLLDRCQGQAFTLNVLIKGQILTSEQREVSRLKAHEIAQLKNFNLSKAQSTALEQIRRFMKEGKAALLHGLTSSGKTQIYIRLIEDCLTQHKQTLYLLPEIALTAQMINRLRAYFGDVIGIYHSKFNPNERAEIWTGVSENKYRIILGARSAIFLPFNNLGLIIIDEEHENSYKQFDPAPRYHARDAALYLARIHCSHVILGSATPAVETYFNAKNGLYGLVNLTERYGNANLPEIITIDLSKEQKKRSLKAHFSQPLLNEILSCLEKKEQIILFQNRRGFAPVLLCRTCSYIAKCIQCDISLTYHRADHKLHCHYCGYRQALFSRCPACGGVHIEQKGFGTEKIEDDLSILLPQVRVARMDHDSTKNKHGHQQLLNNFEEHKTDILVGTQMISKGLDFGNVSLVGIINADAILSYPDFRAFERGFQLMTQVSGRAGRKGEQSKTLIQTYQPKHPILEKVISNNYKAFYEEELLDRKTYLYPPFSRLIRITLKNKDAELLNHSANELAGLLINVFGQRVLGPESPPVAKVRNYFLKIIMLKIERKNISLTKVKNTLIRSLDAFYEYKAHKSTLCILDIDPY